MKKTPQQLSEIQEALVQLLTKSKVPQTDMVALMLVMKDDNLGMANLAEYILNEEPSDTEIMNWLGDFMDNHWTPPSKCCANSPRQTVPDHGNGI